MATILVTAVGGDIGQAVVRCLRDGEPHRILGCDTDACAGGRALVDEFHVAPPAESGEAYGTFIRRLIRGGVDRIFPISDPEIRHFSDHREDFKGTTVFINNRFIVDTFSDKLETGRFLAAGGLDVPRTWLPSRYQRGLPFPFLFKARHGQGGQGLRVIGNQGEFDLYRGSIDDEGYIIQEIVGTACGEYTVGVFSDGEEIRSIAFLRELAGPWGGYSRKVVLVHDQGITDLATTVAKLTGLRGAINLQLRKVGQRNVILEINPRLSSTVRFRHLLWFRDVWWWMDLAEGRKLAAYTPRSGQCVGVKTYDEVIFYQPRPASHR